MNVKIQCSCGSKYSFDVEPQNGRMPFAVHCPTCGLDGTDAANEMLGQSAAAPATPRARISAPLPAPVAATGESYEKTVAVKEMLRQRKEAEERSYRVK